MKDEKWKTGGSRRISSWRHNKVDSHLVKWSGVEDLLEVLYSRSSLFFHSVVAII